jgi:hypothetical protein
LVGFAEDLDRRLAQIRVFSLSRERERAPDLAGVEYLLRLGDERLETFGLPGFVGGIKSRQL